MSGSSERFTYATPHTGTINTFAIRPNGPPPWPTIILIHGANGVGAHTEAKAAAFAAEGYYTVVPDIYSNDALFHTFAFDVVTSAVHMGGDPERQNKFLTKQPPEKRAEIVRARDWVDHRPGSTYIDIIRGCFDHLKSRAEVGAIGTVGYCMGGRLVGELAVSGVDLAAGVIYYGGPPKLDLVPNIRGVLQGHYASTDHGITGRIPGFAAAMKAAGKEFTYYVYEADHGFSLVPDSAGYNAEATRHSLQRVMPFLARNLKAVTEARAAE